MADQDQKFTVNEGDLDLTAPGEPNPHGYSFRVLNDGSVAYYDDDGQPVDPHLPPVTEAQLRLARETMRLDELSPGELRDVAERYEHREGFAARVVARAARAVLNGA